MKRREAINFLRFVNPTKGELVFADMINELTGFISEELEAKYRVMIGSDSKGNRVLDVVSVVAIHRVGSGGRYFWHRSVSRNVNNLRQKIYAEVDASIQLASQILPALKESLMTAADETDLPFDFQIHVDVGSNGRTRDLITEITGMVRAYGYEVLVKPESAAATTFADRHVK